jgi:hypothetical protein
LIDIGKQFILIRLEQGGSMRLGLYIVTILIMYWFIVDCKRRILVNKRREDRELMKRRLIREYKQQEILDQEGGLY